MMESAFMYMIQKVFRGSVSQNGIMCFVVVVLLELSLHGKESEDIYHGHQKNHHSFPKNIRALLKFILMLATMKHEGDICHFTKVPKDVVYFPL